MITAGIVLLYLLMKLSFESRIHIITCGGCIYNAVVYNYGQNCNISRVVECSLAENSLWPLGWTRAASFEAVALSTAPPLTRTKLSPQRHSLHNIMTVARIKT